MNGLVLLMAVLAASYLGSTALASGRRFGFATGVEWLVLGFVLGPAVLAVVASDVVAPMHPVALSAIGWLALVTGIDQGRKTAVRPFVLAVLAALVTGLAVGFAMYILLPLLGATTLSMRRFTSAAIGLACARNHPSRRSLGRRASRRRRPDRVGDRGRYIGGRHRAAGRSRRALRLRTFAEAHLRIPLGPPIWLAITLALGVLLGLVAAALLGPKLRVREAWTVLLGVALLAIGLAARVGLSALTVAFCVGAALALASHHRDELRAMTEITERVALLPVLLLVGAELTLPPLSRLIPLLLLSFAAIAVRTFVHFVLAAIISLGRAAIAPEFAAFALSFASTGALSVCVALACALAYPTEVGSDLLFIVTIVLLVGEAVGPNALRVFLRRAGEISTPLAAPSAKEVAA